MPARILVIDDEDSMCNFMEIMLSRQGFDVDVTTSGGDYLRGRGNRPGQEPEL